jgi:hypothetical protein
MFALPKASRHARPIYLPRELLADPAAIICLSTFILKHPPPPPQPKVMYLRMRWMRAGATPSFLAQNHSGKTGHATPYPLQICCHQLPAFGHFQTPQPLRMRAACVLLVALCAAPAMGASVFQTWSARHGKVYSSPEE